MIEVNLVPTELRIQVKKQGVISWGKIGISAGVLFLIVTSWLYVNFVNLQNRLKELQNRYVNIQPQYLELTQLQQSVEGALKAEKEFMVRFVTSEKPLTSILMWCSSFIPGGVWLSELNLTREGDRAKILIKGLAVSSGEFTSVEQIELYLQRMKEKMPGSALSLTTTRQVREELELTHFTAHFGWGE